MESPSASKDSANAETAPAFYNYRLDLAYIGTSFQGWQSQPNGQTVQDTIERALRIVLRQQLRILGASRTDTGVHAEHQVATFRSLVPIDCYQTLKSVQALVPSNIGILELQPWAAEFHPVIDAKAKVYRYRIWLGSPQNPFVRPYVWHFHHPLDVSLMQKAAQDLLGYHNFQGFCASDASVATFDRTIFDVRWIQRGPILEFYILGDGFLKQMVRCLVGTLTEIGQGKRPADDINRILLSGDRKEAGQTAPAQGLALLRIFYALTDKIPERLISSGAEFGFALGL